jgi:hypothetical protein
MKSLSFFLTALVFVACSSEQAHENEMTPALTAKAWKFGGESTLKFNDDGSYLIEFSKSKMDFKENGVWEWMSKTEIVLTRTAFSFDDRIEKIKPNADDRQVYRITNLTSEKIEGISRHFLDAEDSGFAKPFSFEAE